jgi:hypothetical protein
MQPFSTTEGVGLHPTPSGAVKLDQIPTFFDWGFLVKLLQLGLQPQLKKGW